MQSAYIPVLIYAALVVAFPAVTLILARFIRPASTSVGAKLKPYECGIPPESDARGRYSVRFYIVAMLFVLFDIEVVFLYPWAVIFKDAIAVAGPGIFWWMLSFVTILLVAFVHAWKKGALRWDN